jgi:hypothetical protein
MDSEGYTFTFGEDVSEEEAHGTFLLALVALESLHGKAAVRMDCRFRSDPSAKLFHINSDTDIGNDLAKLFTGFAINAYGYDAVRIRRGYGVSGQAQNSGSVLQ